MTGRRREPLPFMTWLRRQCRREDPVGDLARTAARSAREGHLGRRYRPAGFRRALKRLDASSALLEALEIAEGEWRAVRWGEIDQQLVLSSPTETARVENDYGVAETMLAAFT